MSGPLRLALLYPGDRAERAAADPAASRFAALFDAFAEAGIATEPAVYHDDFADEVGRQLQRLHGVLVWHNPIEGGRTRRRLDALLAALAEEGLFVSCHPTTVARLGTKDVLLAARDLPFGSDVHRIDSVAQLRFELPARLAAGARVLKQPRGHSGIGVWRLASAGPDWFTLRQAQRGATETTVQLDTLLEQLAPYFQQGGHLIDQAWQPGIVDGMTRAYLVRDHVVGFGQQAINALHPTAPTPGPRLYSDADDPRFQGLRQRLEQDWVARLCERLDLPLRALPLLWDADFIVAEPDADGVERHVLCEVNVSSVSPFPSSAIAPLVQATCEALRARLSPPS